VPGAKPVREDLPREFRGPHAAHFPRERFHDEGVDAEQRDQDGFLFHRGDLVETRMGREKPDRVGSKSQRDGRDPGRVRPCDRAPEQFLVPEVDPVEVPDRHRNSGRRWVRGGAVHDVHSLPFLVRWRKGFLP
jgi:hypothetical protein